ncbi:MAG TPA: response regulator transcription factor [Bryobacteraceae bacterium]|nr:response regulator transcription factor [Bryobacteraceae bacterium]
MTVIVCTQEPVAAAGAAALLEPAFQVISCATEDRLIDLLEDPETRILLMDFSASTDLDQMRRVRRAFPDCRIVLRVGDVPPETAFQAIGMGVRGILRRTSPAETVKVCFERVAGGELWVESGLAGGFAGPRAAHLAPREEELVALVSQGLKNKEIAEAIGISEATVRVYLSALFRKIGVKDRYELAIYGLKSMVNLRTGAGAVAARGTRMPFVRVKTPAAQEATW